MYFVYVLSSIKRNYVYVGITGSLERRILKHNLGYNKTTKPYSPFQLLYSVSYPTRIEARTREKYYKSGVGKEKLRKIRTDLGLSAGLSADR